MSELDRTAWAREVHRLEKQIAHRRKRIKDTEDEIAEFEASREELLAKIADDYREDED